MTGPVDGEVKLRVIADANGTSLRATKRLILSRNARVLAAFPNEPPLIYQQVPGGDYWCSRAQLRKWLPGLVVGGDVVDPLVAKIVEALIPHIEEQVGLAREIKEDTAEIRLRVAG